MHTAIALGLKKKIRNQEIDVNIEGRAESMDLMRCFQVVTMNTGGWVVHAGPLHVEIRADVAEEPLSPSCALCRRRLDEGAACALREAEGTDDGELGSWAGGGGGGRHGPRLPRRKRGHHGLSKKLRLERVNAMLVLMVGSVGGVAVDLAVVRVLVDGALPDRGIRAVVEGPSLSVLSRMMLEVISSVLHCKGRARQRAGLKKNEETLRKRQQTASSQHFQIKTQKRHGVIGKNLERSQLRGERGSLSSSVPLDFAHFLSVPLPMLRAKTDLEAWHYRRDRLLLGKIRVDGGMSLGQARAHLRLKAVTVTSDVSRYWVRKYQDPTFHPNLHGGQRWFKFDLAQKEALRFRLPFLPPLSLFFSTFWSSW